ncbi:MAG: hypothetical protein HQL21_05370 [Candidatus Omnitrophica bacterium]|nr:hypothetical protein [Candidatus Omnitrophota bacterium]
MKRTTCLLLCFCFLYSLVWGSIQDCDIIRDSQGKVIQDCMGFKTSGSPVEVRVIQTAQGKFAIHITLVESRGVDSVSYMIVPGERPVEGHLWQWASGYNGFGDLAVRVDSHVLFKAEEVVPGVKDSLPLNKPMIFELSEDEFKHCLVQFHERGINDGGKVYYLAPADFQ